APADPLNPIETQVIDLFVNGVRALGLPKSVGEIYGLLFASPSPLSFDSIVERLKISKGSTSQGLKFLRSLGAVQPVYVAGERKDHFVAETDLKKLVTGFVRGELRPHLDSGSTRVDNLVEHLPANDLAAQDFYKARIGKLRAWHKRARQVLPIIEKFLS